MVPYHYLSIVLFVGFCLLDEDVPPAGAACAVLLVGLGVLAPVGGAFELAALLVHT
jgi:hypothetical protein